MLRSYPGFAARYHTADRIQQLLAALPPGWVTAARTTQADITAGRLQPPTADAAMAVLLPRLGWRMPRRDDPILLASFTVRSGTALLTAPTEQRRTEEHLQPYAAALGATADGLRATLKRLWQLPWENCRKESF